MKKLIRFITLICIVCSFSNNIFAQDIIIKKDNEQLKVKIIEIGTDEVKFKYFDLPDGPMVTMNKRDIKSMKLEGQGKTDKVINVTPDPMSTSNAAILNKTSSLKFHFFSPLTHKLAFSYEWMIRPGFNWEAGVGIIGPGTSLIDQSINGHPQGGYFRTGPKFLLGNSSDIEIEGARYAHPLKGRYFKIEALFNSFSKSYDAPDPNYPSSTVTMHVNEKYIGGAIHLIYGRQYIFGNVITVGWYLGVGYGFEDKTTNVPSKTVIDYIPVRYSHYYYGKDLPLTTTGGFTIGYIFKTPDWIDNIANKRTTNRAPSRHSMIRD